MLRRRISKAGVVLALALACGTSAHAESSLDAVRARGRIRVGVKTDAAPFGFIDARGHPVGFEVDLARFFARVLFDDEGRARLVPVTTSTRFAELQAGRVDLLLATVTVTEQRRTVAELSDPYFTSGSLILVARDGRLAKMRRDGTYRGLWRRYFTPFESHLVGA